MLVRYIGVDGIGSERAEHFQAGNGVLEKVSKVTFRVDEFFMIRL